MRILIRMRRSPAAALIACLIVSSCGEAYSAGRYAGVELIPAKTKPAFTLVSTDGTPYPFREETDRRLALLLFGYTHCADLCPVHLTNIAAALRRLPPEQRNRIRVVFVTTDPARDSLPRLRAWLDNFDRRFIGLRGSADEVSRIETALALPSSIIDSSKADYVVGHASQVLAFTPDDSLRLVYPSGVQAQDWVRDLPRLLSIAERR